MVYEFLSDVRDICLAMLFTYIPSFDGGELPNFGGSGVNEWLVKHPHSPQRLIASYFLYHDHSLAATGHVTSTHVVM